MAPPVNPLANNKNLGELWARLRFLMFALIIYRLGTHVPVPGIDPERIASFFEGDAGVLGLFNMFSGGALERVSILALGIMPYISASIIMQLLGSVSPKLEQLKKEGDAGRRKMSQYTRYLTIVLAIVQAAAVSKGLASVSATYTSGTQFYIISIVSLVTGAMFMMWLGEQITEKGIGNGISMLIFAGIVAGLLPTIFGEFSQERDASSILVTLMMLLLALAIIWFIVCVERGQRRITVNYAKRQQGKKVFAAQSSHLPLKVNMAGVIPAIFASSLLLFPQSIGQLLGGSGSGVMSTISAALQPGQPLQILLFGSLIIFFCFFYTALMFNPSEVADNLKKSGAYIPGIRPGEQSARYIDSVLTRLTVVGSIYMAGICLIPQFLLFIPGASPALTSYLGGTSLLIVVVVLMDFMSQIQSHMMSQQYDSLMKKSNLKGNKSK